jgi:hypothetical protein
MTIKIKNSIMIILWIFVYFTFFAVGFIFGIIYQQVIFIKGITYLTSYSNIEVNVNLNETKLVEKFNETFMPIFKENLNQSLKGGLKNNANK